MTLWFRLQEDTGTQVCLTSVDACTILFNPSFPPPTRSISANNDAFWQYSPAILLTHGGGHGQFAAVPLNLCAAPDRPADYVVTGSWSQAAADEAAPFARVAVAARGTADGLPPREAWVVREDQGRTGVLQRVFNLMFRR